MRRIDNLTGVRAVAALWVVLFHLNPLATPLQNRLGRIVGHGQHGVDVFFVLSGFVLSLVYADSMSEHFQWKDFRRFLVRRLAKLYPLHLLTLTAMIALVETASRLHYHFNAAFGAVIEDNAWTAFCSALMVHALGTTRLVSWNTPSWSVSAEWFAYVVVFTPMVISLRKVRVLFLLLAAVCMLPLLAAATPVFGGKWTDLSTLGVFRIAPEFFCGYVLWRLVGKRGVAQGDAFTLAGCGLLVVTCYVPGADLWLMLPAILGLIAGLHAGGRLSDAFFGNRAMVMLGDASYSIYLLHEFVLLAIKQICVSARLPDTLPARAGVLFAVLIGAGGVGLLCFRYVEEPLRRAIVRRWSVGSLKNPETAGNAGRKGQEAETQVSATIG